MKVYSTPIEFAEPDYRNYNSDAERQREEQHQEAVKQWLLDNGYTGPRTGEIARFGVADGYASYMFADGGRRSALIHLPYGDAWHYPHIEHLPKKAIIEQLDLQKKREAFFARKRA
jgi:hypothetical protein